jgi:hypothetical protein
MPSSQRTDDSKHFPVKVLKLMKGLVIVNPTYVSVNKFITLHNQMHSCYSIVDIIPFHPYPTFKQNPEYAIAHM